MGAFVGEGVFISAKGSGELWRGERGQDAPIAGGITARNYLVEKGEKIRENTGSAMV